jgi:hypothetical protein
MGERENILGSYAKWTQPRCAVASYSECFLYCSGLGARALACKPIPNADGAFSIFYFKNTPSVLISLGLCFKYGSYGRWQSNQPSLAPNWLTQPYKKSTTVAQYKCVSQFHQHIQKTKKAIVPIQWVLVEGQDDYRNFWSPILALFIWLIICFIQLVFSAGTVFFSYKKSANSVF